MLDPRISPDGTRAVFTQAPSGGDTDLYIGVLTYNHPPRMNPGVVDQMLSAGVPYSINLASGASDADGDPIHYKAAYLPPGSTLTGSTFSWPLPVVVGGENVFYTVFVAYDSAGAQDYRVVRYELGGGGGCPFADVLTGSGWVTGNSVSRRSANLSPGIDAYRLAATPVALEGRKGIRIRENESEESSINGAELLIFDRNSEVRSFSAGDRVIVGRLFEPLRVTNGRGEDITSLLTGADAPGIVADPGEALVVEFDPRPSSQPMRPQAASTSPSAADEGGGFYMESGGKELPPEFRIRPPTELAAASPDERTLRFTGVDVQVPDGDGWRTLLRHYPRATLDGAALGEIPAGTVRLLFVGRHRVRALGRVVAAENSGSSLSVEPTAARHSRRGSVCDVVRGEGPTGTMLVLGDTLELEFDAPPAREGTERDFYLVTRGAYRTATGPLTSGGPDDPRSGVHAFALGTARPNPSRGVTVIPFALPAPSTVRLQVFDATGRLVRSLLQDERGAGTHSVEWDRRADSGTRVGAGIYFYKLVVPDREATRKVVLLGD